MGIVYIAKREKTNISGGEIAIATITWKKKTTPSKKN